MSDIPMTVRRAALYARVSSQQQAQANTIASQVEALEARIRADGLTLEAELRFLDDGYSGGTLLRPALERLRDQAATGSFDRLYVHSPDRLARHYPYQFVLVEELQRHGIELIFLNCDMGRTPEENLLLQVQGMMAEYERTKILERSRRGKRHAARAGLVNVLSGAPYGYRYLRKHEGGGQARYQVEETQAAVVRQMFAWVALERCSLGEVCRRLNARGLLSPHGKRWGSSTVANMLQNPAYVGRAAFGKRRIGPPRPGLRPRKGCLAQPRRSVSTSQTPIEERIGIPVPPLVSEATFAAVAEQLAENRRRKRERGRGQRPLLAGLLVCAECGYAYCSRRSRRQAYAYYRCTTGSNAERFSGQRLCRNRPCRADVLDRLVWDDVAALLAEPDRVRQEYERRWQRRRQKTQRPTEQLQHLLGRVRRGISRLIDAYQEGYLEREEFEPRLRSAKERLARLEAESQTAAERDLEVSNLQRVLDHLQSFANRVREGLQQADSTTRREILQGLVKQVELGKEAIRVVYKVPADPFDRGPIRGPKWQHCPSGKPCLGGHYP